MSLTNAFGEYVFSHKWKIILWYYNTKA